MTRQLAEVDLNKCWFDMALHLGEWRIGNDSDMDNFRTCDGHEFDTLYARLGFPDMGLPWEYRNADFFIMWGDYIQEAYIRITKFVEEAGFDDRSV